jgi:hypothetical protein
MKNVLKAFGIIVILAVIIFSTTAHNKKERVSGNLSGNANGGFYGRSSTGKK